MVHLGGTLNFPQTPGDSPCPLLGAQVILPVALVLHARTRWVCACVGSKGPQNEHHHQVGTVYFTCTHVGVSRKRGSRLLNLKRTGHRLINEARPLFGSTQGYACVFLFLSRTTLRLTGEGRGSFWNPVLVGEGQCASLWVCFKLGHPPKKNRSKYNKQNKQEIQVK